MSLSPDALTILRCVAAESAWAAGSPWPVYAFAPQISDQNWGKAVSSLLRAGLVVWGTDANEMRLTPAGVAQLPTLTQGVTPC